MGHAAELVSTGAELLSGRTVNRHARSLGAALGALGIRLVRDTTVPDDRGQIADAVRGALDRAGLVFVSGGLGPTVDDVTRDALADVLGRAVVVDEGARAQLADRYRQAGREVTAMAVRQVLVLEGAEVLPNPVGLAPGQRLEAPGGQVVFVLPGPPREFAAVLEAHVLPWLAAHRAPERPPRERVFMVGAVPEADVARRFEEAGLPPPGIDLAFCAAPGRVEVRLTGSEADGLEEAAGAARRLLGDDAYAEARVSIEEAVVRGLVQRHLSLATVEGASDGALARGLAGAPESRLVYRGGLVAGRNRLLTDLLGIGSDFLRREGAAGEAAAARMAAAVRDRLGADVGLAVTDVAPGDGDPAPGTVYVGIDDGRRTATAAARPPGRGTWRAAWIVHAALDRLRRVLDLPACPRP